MICKNLFEQKRIQSNTESEDEKIVEIQTKLGCKIIIYENSSSGSEKIEITRSNLEADERLLEINATNESLSVSTKMDLSIKASSIEIEAKESMKIKSGDIMTINGSLVKIN